MATAQSLIDANVARSAETGLGRLAAWCYDHRRRVLLGWLVAVVAIIGLAQWAGSRLDNNFTLASSPSQQAQNLLASRFPSQKGDSADVVLRSPSPLDSPANAAAIGRLVRSLQPLAHVSGVQSPLTPGASRQLSPSRRIGFVVVQFDAAAADLPASAVWRVIDTARSFAHPGLQVEVGGAPVEQVVSAAPGSSEMIGLLAAVVVMLLAFGSVVAMGLPILSALVGVGMGFGILVALSHLITVPTFGPDMMIMIGLGVGIDYALFVVTRYRQGLAGRQPPRAATIVALATAGRAVLFAGATVVIALLGLFVVGLPFMDGLAAATIVAVALVLVAALTLLPAIFGFAGTAIDRLHIPGLLARPGAATSRGFWSRWSETVQKRPWVCAASALAVLVVLAMPLFSMCLAFSDAGNDPASLTTRQAYDLLAEGFGPGFNGPLIVAADLRGPRAQASIARLDARLSQVQGVASASPPVINAARDAAVIIVYPTTAPQSAQTASLVHRLRDQVIPQVTADGGLTAFVGGETAAGVDTSAYLSGRLPWVIGMVVLLAFLLLVVVFRSIAIPLKAAAMNLLSMGAAYGVIVAVYQWGWLASVFGVSRAGPVDPWIPLMMFTIVFGLSMDYEVFLLSRMREEWLRSGDNSKAVASGLSTTARVITAAAAIMVCVFGSFVIGDPLRILGVFGLGLAVAVLVDATVVRMVLVPAVMQLLGSANWWLPRWIGRVTPNLAIELNLAIESDLDHRAAAWPAPGRSAQRPRSDPAIPAAERRSREATTQDLQTVRSRCPAAGRNRPRLALREAVMRQPAAGVVSVAWGVAVGGTFGCLLPYLLNDWHFHRPLPYWAVAQAAGVLLICAGLVPVVRSFIEFTKADGTPVPVASPPRLVVSGFYRYVRNPIYVGFLAILMGEVLLFGSQGLLEYTAVAWCIGAAAVRFYEEPTLARKFGAEYQDYRRAVRAWIPRLHPWTPGEPTRSGRT